MSRSIEGASKPRVHEEDLALVTGTMRFVDDIKVPGMLHVAFLPSPMAHGAIGEVHRLDALAVEGVVAVITGEDLRDKTMPIIGAPTGWTNHPLAVDRVRYFGEPLVAVVATSRRAAEAGCRRLTVDLEPLPFVRDAEAAVAAGAPVLHPDQESNVVFHQTFSYGAVEQAFEKAAHRICVDVRWKRNSGNPLETGGVIAVPSERGDELDVYTNMQASSFLSGSMATQIGIPKDCLRIHRCHTGGSFGSKVTFGRYVVLVAVIAKQLGRPVKFVEDRMEHLRASSSHGPDRTYRAEAAVEGNGKIEALRISCLDNFGAYIERRPGAAVRPLACLPGCYDIRNLEYELKVAVSNQAPQGSYRGYGPNVHSFVLERLIDTVARELGLDPVAVREVNFVAPEDFPYRVATGLGFYDSGNYSETLETLLQTGEYKKWRAIQERARGEGRLLGIGLATTVEPGGFFDNALYGVIDGSGPLDIPEAVSITLGRSGEVTVRVGYGSEGQKHDSLVRRLVAEALALDESEIDIVHANSVQEPESFGPGGSRMAVALSGALQSALEEVVEALRTRVAIEWSAPVADIITTTHGFEGMDGRTASFLDAQGMAGGEAITCRKVWRPDRDLLPLQTASYLTTANAAHMAVVEVDRSSGEVSFLDYHCVSDCGTVMDPETVRGQIQGGVAQGIGAILHERYEYDENGRLLTDSWQTYLVPETFDVPKAKQVHLSTPSPFTSHGQKGTGEGAMNTTPAAVANAITDALSELGIRINSVPITPAEISNQIFESAIERTCSE